MKFNRYDKILIALLVFFNAGLFYYFGSGFNKGDWVIIKVEDKNVARFPLTTDRVVQVEGPLGTTEVEIRQGKARILRSPCKLKVCIKSGYIQYADRLSACLPNKVVVRIEGETQRGLDAVVG
ncbi:MAG: NusG domain II-containing protein [Nitrospina sp.]|jgi:hypothetical protein|nr:NusG domain II-containing protein [Nitrospina sp.]MBT5632034.1 NusG domain II-containing protein [Nitrospina sp.]